MNLNKLLKKLRLPFLILFIFYACTSEHDSVEEKKPIEPLTVESASLLYQKYIGNTASLKNGEDNTLSMIPDWESGQLFNYPGWDVVESPLGFEGNTRFAMMTDKVSEHVEQQGDDISQSGQQLRLVVMQNSENGKAYTFIMQIIPDLDYLQKGHEKVADNRFMERESGLDGFVMFYMVDGTFLNGWRYKEGRITGEVPQEEGDDIPRTKALVPKWDCEGYTEYFVEDGEVYKAPGIICYKYYEDNGVFAYDPDVPGNLGAIEPIEIGQIGSGGGDKDDPSKDKDKKPEDRKDCSEQAISRASDVKNILKVTADMKEKTNDMRYKAQNDSDSEYFTKIDFLEAYSIDNIQKGGESSASADFAQTTIYGVHTHNGKGGGYTGPSVYDIQTLLQANNYFYTKYGNNKYNLFGIVIFAFDGSEYLISLDDRVQANSFYKDNPNSFNSDMDDNFFSNMKIYFEFNQIMESLSDEGYSKQDSYDYSMSYILDKYNTGIKIYKKEKDDKNFGEMKTEEESDKYKPKKCPGK